MYGQKLKNTWMSYYLKACPSYLEDEKGYDSTSTIDVK